MTTLMNGFAGMIADGYSQTAAWVVAHPVMTTVSITSIVALMVILVGMGLAHVFSNK